MIQFRTSLALSPSHSVQDFHLVALEWLRGGRNYQFVDELNSLPEPVNYLIPCESQSFECLVYKENEVNKIGYRIRLTDLSGEWTTRIVSFHNGDEFKVSIDIDFEKSTPSPNSPEVKIPIILRKITEKMMAGKDGELQMSAEPIRLSDLDIDFAANLINGKIRCFMPIVYLSAEANARNTINPWELSKAMFGLAHVIAEPNVPFSRRLRIQTAGRNAHLGAIGVYWPSQAGRQILWREEGEDEKSLVNRIQQVVLNSLIDCRLDPEVSWFNLERDINRSRIDAITREGNNTLEELSEVYKNDNHILDQLLAESERENVELKAKIRRLQALMVERPEGSMLKQGKEREFYTGEFADMVLSLVERELESVEPNWRRKVVLQSILEANPRYWQRTGNHGCA
jgi:hypothetical protein